MRLSIHRASRRARAGFTLLEVTIVAALMAVMLYGAFTVVTRDTQLGESILHIGNVELRCQQMLFTLERELSDADGNEPLGVLGASLTATQTDKVEIGSTLGYPDQGILLVDRGTNKEERIRYESFQADQETLLLLERGIQGTNPGSHAFQAEVHWAGIAVPLDDQTPGQADLWDGRALVPGGSLFFVGDGTGFSYRKPVDPFGANDYLVEDDIQWGGDIHGVQTTDAWSCIYFQERLTLSEAAIGQDINNDGDEDDVFDIGQLRRRTWDTTDPNAQVLDLGLGPTGIFQERDNWGGDLDGDGFDDPILLWDPSTRQLHMSLFLIGRSESRATVRRVGSTVFLRNQFQS